MMTLPEYLTSSGTTQRSFAAKIGVSRSYLSEIVSGLKTPSLSTALRISAESGGAVSLATLIAPHEAQGSAQ